MCPEDFERFAHLVFHGFDGGTGLFRDFCVAEPLKATEFEDHPALGGQMGHACM
jgi:hypothetical protein